ncbi:MAG TPA: apolipoprotein N-acyltransferase [Thermodesulfobacteriota bacterium]|nr:apolipoprotein N-acyltransferase [Thermodesulfobacteriota bacterium]
MAKIINLFLSLLAPALTGVLLALAFPSYQLDWLAWIAFVPLLLRIRGRKPWQAFFMFWFCGVVFFLGITPWWIKEFQFVSILATALGYLYLGFYFALFGLFLSLIPGRIRLSLLIAAPVWVALEYLRSNLSFLAFPWALLGHTQYLNLPLIQMASLTGVYGVSFVIMLANGAIANLISHWVEKNRRRERGSFIPNPIYGGVVVFGIILALWVVGWKILTRESSGRLFSVAVVQGNIPQKVKWDREYREQIISHYENLTEEAAKSNPQLIVWPEAATPGFVLNDLSLLRRVASMTRRLKTYLLIGSAEYPKFLKTSAKLSRGNTALFFSPEGKVLGQYLKIRLVPFGEYIPYEGIIPWPDFIIQRRKRNFDIAGSEATLFQVDGNQFGTLICWEVLFPDLTRNLVKKGADFVINLTNEAWFGRIAFPYQMLSSCVFRAVENRVNLVRCANTGISCFIDPYGRIKGRVTNEGKDVFVSGTLSQNIFISPPGTSYTRHGDLLVYGCIAFLVAIVVWKSVKGISNLANQKT